MKGYNEFFVDLNFKKKIPTLKSYFTKIEYIYFYDYKKIINL